MEPIATGKNKQIFRKSEEIRMVYLLTMEQRTTWREKEALKFEYIRIHTRADKRSCDTYHIIVYAIRNATTTNPID